MPIALHLLDKQGLLAVDDAVVVADVGEDVGFVVVGGLERSPDSPRNYLLQFACSL